jgi:hypothetical protein
MASKFTESHRFCGFGQTHCNPEGEIWRTVSSVKRMRLEEASGARIALPAKKRSSPRQ